MQARETERTATPARGGVRRILAMEVVSGAGDGVFWVGLVAALLDRGAGAGAFAVAALVRLGPRALLGAPAGALADRIDRRVLLVVLDVARAVCMVVLALASASGASATVLFAVVLVSYVLAAPYRPALTAGLPYVAGERGLASANAQVGTIRQVMTFVGPLIGAAVVHWSPAEVAFWVNAATFVLAGALLAAVPGLSSGSGAAAADAGAAGHGWQTVLATPGLAVVAVLVFVMYAVRGAELVLYVLAAEDQLGLGAGGIGVLTGAVGLGAVAAMPVASRLADMARPDLVFAASLLLTAIPFAALGWISSPVLACAVLVVVGATVVVFEVASVVVLLRVADTGVLGRVFGVVASSSNGGKLAGAIVAPAIVAWAGLRGAFVAVGVVVLVVCVATMPALRALTAAGGRRQAALRPVADVLGRLGLLQGASPAALQQLAAAVVAEPVRAGQVLIRQGDEPDDLFVVRDGEFDAWFDGRVVNTIHVDGWFGEIGLLHRIPRTASVVARTDGVVWRIPGDTFLAALADVGTMPTALLTEMSERLRRVTPPPA
jgi:MFS family permease